MNEHDDDEEEENTKKLFHFNYYLKEMPNLLVLYVYFHNTQNLSTFFHIHMCDKDKEWYEREGV